MSNPPADRNIIDALDAIIQGKVVTRNRHNLIYDNRDLSAIFVERLAINGYLPQTVRNASCAPGERIPAFYLEKSVAYFGWIFWEQFTSRKMRKLWGSVVKNPKGDWQIQIPVSIDSLLYANEKWKREMDILHPQGI